MKQVKVIIERSADLYSSFAENLEGIYGGGETVAEAKQSIIDAIALYKEYNQDIPDLLKGDYELVYQFDTESLLNYYKGIFTNAALERITGINQKQLQHYASGLKKPRATQAQKIEYGLHALANELLAIKL
ncbi:type II toxin-antitoxin system HicB family antitoxin [Pedobacter alpinus]|uniref:Type II toxin-antitoxin system HicB family antitoxin n=1 Tax=Pedobacter alpinus TaxID=1590643 RepID=A0ABW5TW75_9SPHI